MTDVNQNDTFYANNKRKLKFTITNKDVTPNVPLDLTGMIVRWAMSRFGTSGDYSTTSVLRKDNDALGGVAVIGSATDGVVEVTIEPEDTASLSGNFYQELEVVDGSGDPVVVATGKLIIKKNVRNTA